MNINCSEVIHMASMIWKKWHGGGNDDVLVPTINW